MRVALSELCSQRALGKPIRNAVKSIFAENLRGLMQERNLTAKEISRATGISKSTLSEWLGGRVPRFGEDVVKLAQFLNVSLEFLANGKEAEEKVVNELLAQSGNNFATIHTGVYRINVEKFIGPDSRKPEKK